MQKSQQQQTNLNRANNEKQPKIKCDQPRPYT